MTIQESWEPALDQKHTFELKQGKNKNKGVLDYMDKSKVGSK